VLAGFVHLLRENKLLLLFLVSAIGYLVGRVKIGSFSLGVAAVLFVGLGFGALDRELNLPELVYQFGLVLTVRIGAKFVGKKRATRDASSADRCCSLGSSEAGSSRSATTTPLFKTATSSRSLAQRRTSSARRTPWDQ
jgi:hypothetical protein